MNIIEKSTPFLIVYFVILFFSSFQVYSKREGRALTFLIYPMLIVIVSLFSGLATSKISPDYLTYQYAFNDIHTTDNILGLGLSMEYGFIVFNKIVSFVFADFNFFLIIFSFSVQLVLYFSYKKISPYPILSLLMYFVHYYLGRDLIAIRSALAYAIVLLAIVDYSLDNKIKKYFIYILGASLFHTTTLLALCLPTLFYFFNANYKLFLKTSLPVALLLGFLLPVEWIFSIAGRVIGDDSVQYNVYFNNDNNFYELGVFSLINIKNIVISLYFYFKRRSNEHMDFLIFSYMVGSLGLIAFNKMGIISGRGFSQFVFIDTVLIAVILSENIKNRSLVYIGIVLYTLTLLIANISRDGAYFYETVLF